MGISCIVRRDAIVLITVYKTHKYHTYRHPSRFFYLIKDFAKLQLKRIVSRIRISYPELTYPAQYHQIFKQIQTANIFRRIKNVNTHSTCKLLFLDLKNRQST